MTIFPFCHGIEGGIVYYVFFILESKFKILVSSQHYIIYYKIL